MRVLDVGCGLRKTPGAIGLDLSAGADADVLADAQDGWPFTDSVFDRIVCRHVVEHVSDVVGFIGEALRVCQAGAIIEIVTPHYSNRSSYTDPTHIRHLAWRSFDFFVSPPSEFELTVLQRALELRHPLNTRLGSGVFSLRRRFLSFARPFRWVGIQWLANRFPDLYEFYLAFVFPARDLYVELEVVKDPASPGLQGADQ